MYFSRLIEKKLISSILIENKFRLLNTFRYVHQKNVQEDGRSNLLNIEHSETFDLIVNGGGIVGLSFFLSLQKSPYFKNIKILLLEQQAFPNILPLKDELEKNTNLSNRVSSLTKASKQYFENCNIWNEIKPFAKPIDRMKVWSFDFDKSILFESNEFQMLHELNSVCYIVENNKILNAINRNINHEKIKYDCKVLDLKQNEDQIEVYTSNNEKFTTKLLIGCDGFNSLVRQKSNLKYFDLDLNQNAIVGTVDICKDFENPNNSISYQRFLPTKDKTVIAILPLNNNSSSFVISTSKELSKKLIELDDDKFVDKFNQLLSSKIILQETFFDSVYKNFEKLFNFENMCKLESNKYSDNIPQILSLKKGSRALFPLKFGTTLPSLVGGLINSNYINLALIGDACHRVHPLAGQGLNLGLGDAFILSKVLISSLERGEQLFNANSLRKENLDKVLNEFERERHIKLIAMMSIIHLMQDLFKFTPSNLINIFNKMDYTKQKIVRFANSV